MWIIPIKEVEILWRLNVKTHFLALGFLWLLFGHMALSKLACWILKSDKITNVIDYSVSVPIGKDLRLPLCYLGKHAGHLWIKKYSMQAFRIIDNTKKEIIPKEVLTNNALKIIINIWDFILLQNAVFQRSHFKR